jgi:hypothetical protein
VGDEEMVPIGWVAVGNPAERSRQSDWFGAHRDDRIVEKG